MEYLQITTNVLLGIAICGVLILIAIILDAIYGEGKFLSHILTDTNQVIPILLISVPTMSFFFWLILHSYGMEAASEIAKIVSIF